jgi:hypothetical protein
MVERKKVRWIFLERWISNKSGMNRILEFFQLEFEGRSLVECRHTVWLIRTSNSLLKLAMIQRNNDDSS